MDVNVMKTNASGSELCAVKVFFRFQYHNSQLQFIQTIAQAVVAGFSLHMPRVVLVGFLVNEVALRQVLLYILSFPIHLPFH